MSSAFDSYRSSSTTSSLRTPHYSSPSHLSDLSHANNGSDRAEFHDRYQNRVSIFDDIELPLSHLIVCSMHGSKKITLLKLVHNTNH